MERLRRLLRRTQMAAQIVETELLNVARTVLTRCLRLHALSLSFLLLLVEDVEESRHVVNIQI